MENKQFVEIEETGVAKVTVGIRVDPSLKMELNDEAAARGLTMSEFGELLLSTRHESQQLKRSNEEFKKEIERLTAELRTKHALAVNAEINALKEQMEVQNRQLSIFSDERLLLLFKHLKGKTDTVENAYGDNFGITYETTREVLIAIIYNSKLNQ